VAWLKVEGEVQKNIHCNKPVVEVQRFDKDVGCLMIKNFTLRLFILQYLAIKWCLAEQTG